MKESPGDQPAYLVVDGVGERVTLQLPGCDASWALVEGLTRVMGEHGEAEIEAIGAPPAGV